jgi:hypothetical protein
MIKYYYPWMLTFVPFVALILLLTLIRSSRANAQPAQQYPIIDSQNSTCNDLYQQKNQKAPRAPEEKKAVEFLHNDPQIQAAFINKVAPPIANKLFDCELIP